MTELQLGVASPNIHRLFPSPSIQNGHESNEIILRAVNDGRAQTGRAYIEHPNFESAAGRLYLVEPFEWLHPRWLSDQKESQV